MRSWKMSTSCVQILRRLRIIEGCYDSWSQRLHFARWVSFFGPKTVFPDLFEDFLFGNAWCWFSWSLLKRENNRLYGGLFLLDMPEAWHCKAWCACQLQLAKQLTQNIRLYTPLLVPDCLWQDISFDFIFDRQKTYRQIDSIVVVVDRFSKWLTSYLEQRPLMPLKL